MVRQSVNLQKYKHIWKDLLMANDIPDDRNVVFKIDVLIGNDYYEDIISSEKIELEKGLYLVNSTLGWIFSGRINTNC